MSDPTFTSMFPDLADIDQPAGWTGDLDAMRAIIGASVPTLPSRYEQESVTWHQQQTQWGSDADKVAANSEWAMTHECYRQARVDSLVKARQDAERASRLVTIGIQLRNGVNMGRKV